MAMWPPMRGRRKGNPMSDVATMPKLCHECGADLQRADLWLYERDGVFDAFKARCKGCRLREAVEQAERNMIEALWTLQSNQAAYLAYLRGQMSQIP